VPARTISIPCQTFAQLKRAVAETFLEGQRRADELRVRTYWETGRHIHQHLLLNQDRAEYGAGVIPQLADELKADERTLYQCLQFYRAFPILGARPVLSWAHYRRLMQLADSRQRAAVTAEAIKKNWSSAKVSEHVAQLNAASRDADDTEESQASADDSRPKPRLLSSKLGTPGLFRIVARNDGLAIDLGFKFYQPLDAEAASAFKAGDIVSVDGRGKPALAAGATKADLFTYAVKLVRVIDGDTLLVEVALPPFHTHERKLRLRAIDCPEMITTEGKAAKRFVDDLITRTVAVTVTTTKPDKYDRYLAAVFLTVSSGSSVGAKTAEPEEIFLNNALLENGHASRTDVYTGGDWGQA
jgi:endonuclease YncB( thermonuclease family)